MSAERRGVSVFLSSTIADFRDLRSAIKHWLNELGYRVQLSEYNDFDKDITQNSFDACFSAIRTADVYILLIGGRRGAWYREDERITVTQMEYRVAYGEAQSRGLPILVFKRDWLDSALVHASNGNAVQTKIQTKPIMRAKVLLRALMGLDSSDTSHSPPSFNQVDDPLHLAGFLAEVGRNAEVESSAKSGTSPPRNNWIHTFRDISDIASACRVGMSINSDIPTQILTADVLAEIDRFLCLCLMKTSERPQLYTEVLEVFRHRHRIETARDAVENSHIFVERKDFGFLLHFVFVPVYQEPFAYNAIRKAAYWAGFSRFDPVSRTVRPTRLMECIKSTLNAFDLLFTPQQERWVTEARSHVLATADSNRSGPRIPVETRHLLGLYSFGQRLQKAMLEAYNLMMHLRFGFDLANAENLKTRVKPIEESTPDADKVPRKDMIREFATRRGISDESWWKDIAD